MDEKRLPNVGQMSAERINREVAEAMAEFYSRLAGEQTATAPELVIPAPKLKSLYTKL